MASKPETTLQRKIREELLKLFPSLYIIKIHGGMYQEPGIPDLLLCVRGRFIGLEVKIPGEEPTQLQLDHIARIRASGGKAGIVESVNEAIKFVKKYY